MNWLKTQTIRFSCKEDGVTAIEYALIAALTTIVIVTTVGLVGTNLLALFNAVADAFP